MSGLRAGFTVAGSFLRAGVVLLVLVAGGGGSSLAQGEGGDGFLEKPDVQEKIIPDSALVPAGEAKKQNVFERTQKIMAQMPRAIQDELIREGTEGLEYCRNNTLLDNLYDCDCFSMTLVEKRIESGPDLPFFDLVMSMDIKECIATAQIAGYGFGRCHAVFSLKPMTDKVLNDICRCVGRRMANEYTRAPNPDMRYVDRMFSAASIDCKYHGGGN